jgi:eukaryotic-like serine/threonine-protein kinase
VLAASTRLGPYEIVAPLGAGGMGEVYRARDTRLGREVAVKVLPELFAQDPGRLARFEGEARAVAALSHPNILAIHDYGTHGTVTYAVMELLEGQTLGGRLTQGPLPWREAVEIGAAIAEGLAAAHAKGIVHRDLKPDNLFLTADGRLKILDFGLARIMPLSSPQSETGPYSPATTDAGTVMGTVGYMSPEQLRGRPTEAPSDLFSFGCVLYEMVTGRRAFRRDTAAETMTAILHDEPPDPTDSGNHVPAELWRVIRHCLAKSPNQRLHSARDLALALRAAVSDARLQTPVPRPSTRDIVEAGAVEALAVLPFDNVGGDPKTEYLSDGLADHLIISLSQVRRDGLKVRPFSSVSRYKRQRTDVLTIGRELNVQVLVTGTLHQPGEDLWISVALVDAREDNHLWGKRYQGKLIAILDLQDQIAQDVAVNLRLHLTGEEAQRLTKRYTENPEAYLLYREAIHHWNKFTEDGLKTAIEYCRRALLRDPNYALAYVGLAQCYVLYGNLYRGPLETFPEAKRCAEKALEIDDTLPEAHTFLGAVHLFHDWKWATAERELKLGVGSDPRTASLTLHGFCLAALGRLSEALAAFRRGQELDPLAPAHRNELAMCYNWLREYDHAIAEAQRALDLDPNFPLAHAELGMARVQSGMVDDAIAALLQAITLGQKHPSIKGMLGYAYAAAGRRSEAVAVVNELMAIAPGRFGFALPIARILADVGETDQAFEWLHKACDERTPFVIWLKVDPTFDKLRSDPRFTQVLNQMGLPP